MKRKKNNSENNDCICFRKFFNDKFRCSQIRFGLNRWQCQCLFTIFPWMLPFNVVIQFGYYVSPFLPPVLIHQHLKIYSRKTTNFLHILQLFHYKFCWKNDASEYAEAKHWYIFFSEWSGYGRPSLNVYKNLNQITLHWIELRSDLIMASMNWFQRTLFFFCYNYHRYYAIYDSLHKISLYWQSFDWNVCMFVVVVVLLTAQVGLIICIDLKCINFKLKERKKNHLPLSTRRFFLKLYFFFRIDYFAFFHIPFSSPHFLIDTVYSVDRSWKLQKYRVACLKCYWTAVAWLHSHTRCIIRIICIELRCSILKIRWTLEPMPYSNIR